MAGGEEVEKEEEGGEEEKIEDKKGEGEKPPLKGEFKNKEEEESLIGGLIYYSFNVTLYILH